MSDALRIGLSFFFFVIIVIIIALQPILWQLFQSALVVCRVLSSRVVEWSTLRIRPMVISSQSWVGWFLFLRPGLFCSGLFYGLLAFLF